MSKKFLSLAAILAAVALTAVACTPKQPPKPADTATNSDQKTQGNMAQDEVIVVLNAQNNSGQSGTAVLKNDNGATRVTITLDGALVNIAQPAHIHLSKCATIGGVAYPLNSVVNGQSETVVSAPLAQLITAEQLSINVHKSAEDVKTYVACGDLPYKNDNSMKDQIKPDAMMKGNSTSSDSMKKDGTSGDTMMAKTQTFNVSGSNFAFSVKEIKVKKGDTVKINFSSADGFHDWVIDAFNAHTSRVNSGQSASVEFTADQVGTFEYYCSVGSHRSLGMTGKLIVE